MVRLPQHASDLDFVGVALRHGHGYEFSGVENTDSYQILAVPYVSKSSPTVFFCFGVFVGIGGYKLGLTANNSWFLNTSCSVRTVCNSTTLAHGHIVSDGHDAHDAHALLAGPRSGWQNLSLQAVGSTLTAKINGNAVATAVDSQWANGYAGLFCGWHPAYAKSFSVEAAGRNTVS